MTGSCLLYFWIGGQESGPIHRDDHCTREFCVGSGSRLVRFRPNYVSRALDPLNESVMSPSL